MMFSKSDPVPLHLFLLLLLSARTIPATPAVTETQASLATPITNLASLSPPSNPTAPSNNSSLHRVDFHCFVPGEALTLEPTNKRDCTAALDILRSRPHFYRFQRFSKNTRSGAIMIPLSWQSGACRIVLSVDNDRDTDTFRLLDAARVAKKVIRACVENPMPNPRWGVLRWGGVDGLGDQAENFYVSVGRPVGARGLGVGNGTVLVEES